MTSEQTRSRSIEADWIRVTHGTVAKTLLLSVLISLVTAPVLLLLGNPVGQAAGLDGSVLSWVWSFLGSAAIVLVVVGPWLLLRAAPGVLAHESGEQVRVGWFTVPAARIRRARLVPDAFLHGRLVVRLLIAWTPDVRIGFAGRQGLEVDRRGLEALIRVVQRSSIEQEPGMRPRLLLEPGASEIDPRLRLERDMAQVEPTSYSREVLLRELSRLRDAAADEQSDPATSFARVTGWWQPEDFYREVPGRIRRFLKIDAPAADGAVPQLSTEDKQRMRARGVRFAADLETAESWLLDSAGGTGPVVRRDGVWWAGVAVIVFSVFAAISPCFAFGPVAILVGDLMTVLAIATVLFLLSPLLLWTGIVLLRWGRQRRFERARQAVITLWQRGAQPPNEVIDSLRPPFPSTGLRSALFSYLLGLTLVPLVLGVGCLILSGRAADATVTLLLVVAGLVLLAVALVLIYRAAILIKNEQQSSLGELLALVAMLGTAPASAEPGEALNEADSAG